MTLCAAVYDPPHRADRSDTHTCDLKDEHDGPHHCDLCGTYWTARLDVPINADARDARAAVVRREVAEARRDADQEGHGFVMIVRGGAGGYRYERIAPDLVILQSDRDDEDAYTDAPTLAEQLQRLVEQADEGGVDAEARGRRGWVHTSALKALIGETGAGNGDGAGETDGQEMERRG